jgi:hypothetical protein
MWWGGTLHAADLGVGHANRGAQVALGDPKPEASITDRFAEFAADSFAASLPDREESLSIGHAASSRAALTSRLPQR